MVVRGREGGKGETVLTSVLPLMAGDLNCNDVPVVIVPVLVTESAALASYVEEKKVRGCISFTI